MLYPIREETELEEERKKEKKKDTDVDVILCHRDSCLYYRMDYKQTTQT